MPIPDIILENWSKPADDRKAKNAFALIRDMIKANMTGIDVIPFGSYANGTNVREDNPADMIVFIKDGGYNTRGADDVKYARDRLFDALDGKTEMSFSKNDRGIMSKGFGNIVPVKVVPFVRYGPEEEGGMVTYYHDKGKYGVSYPIQDRMNCDDKDVRTGGNYKKVIRMFKNARDLAVRKGLLGEGTCPSSGLEGLLYNVPDEKYSGRGPEAFRNVMMWLYYDKAISTMVMQNGIQHLFGDSVTAWNIQDARTVIDRISYMWGSWERIGSD